MKSGKALSIYRYGNDNINVNKFIGIINGIDFVTGNVNAPIRTIKTAEKVMDIMDMSRKMNYDDLNLFLNISNDIQKNADELLYPAEKLAELKKISKFVEDEFARTGKTVRKVEVIVKGADEITDIAKLKNINAVTPTGKNLTNLKKTEFVENGYKVKPLSGSLKTKIDDIIANGDNLGAKTEGIIDDIMSSNGYTKMDGKYGSNNGYDGIFIKGTAENPTEIIIVESKQFKYTNGVADDVIEHSGITLNPPSGTTPLPAQMSDNWIEYVRVQLDQAGKTDIAQMIFLNKPKITKYVTAVDKAQAEINFLKLGAY